MRAGHAVPLSPDGAEQDCRSAQGRVVAACIRARLRRPDPGCRPPVWSGELLEPCDRPLDTRSVEGGEESCDAVAAKLDLSGPDAAAALARLELLGYVTCSSMGVYSRTLLPSTPSRDI